tara:strand:- start:952 stop:1188 length:237 start_codon:yes stop_codon:yes gene_type:complete
MLEPFTLGELAIFSATVIGAIVAICKVSACQVIKCGFNGFYCERARIPASELEVNDEDKSDFDKAIEMNIKNEDKRNK